MVQKAIEVGFDKAIGTLRKEALDEALASGYAVTQMEQSGGGSILVIVEKPDGPQSIQG